MKIRALTNKTGKLVQDNSPTILTALGVVGVVSTAYLTGKASFKAAEILAFEQNSIDRGGRVGDELRRDLDGREQFELVWKLYIPAVTTAVLTASCIICANRIGTRRAAAVTAAYAISERAYSEYKEKVIEQIGKTKEQKVRDSVAHDRVHNNPVDSQQVIVTGGGDIMCFDMYTGRYFFSDMETLKKAQNDFNHQLISHDSASLSEFYSKVGLSNTKNSDNVGWRSDRLLELVFTTIMSDDGKPCIAVDFDVAPSPAAFRSH